MAGCRLFSSPHPLPLLHSLLIRDFKGHGEGEIGRLCLPTWVLCSRRRCRLLVASGGSPRWGGSHHLFALAATACGRRQSGVCGFAALGIFGGGLQRQCEFECGGSSRAAGLIPCPFSITFGIRDFEGHGEGRCQSALPFGWFFVRAEEPIRRWWVPSVGTVVGEAVAPGLGRYPLLFR